MFAVVKFSEEPHGILKKFFSRFSEKRVFTEKVSVAPGVFFFLLECSFTYERADWNLIEECAGATKAGLFSR